MTDEWLIIKDLEKSGRSHIAVLPNIYLEGLRKTTKILSQNAGVQAEYVQII
jgi:hypothetical protein